MHNIRLLPLLTCLAIACADDPASPAAPDMAPDMAAPDMDVADVDVPDVAAPDLAPDADMDAPDLPDDAPRFTTTPPATATERVALLYAPDCEASEATTQLSVAPEDTCGGVFADGAYQWTPDETQGGAACTLAIRCEARGVAVVQRGEVTVVETNEAPVLASAPEQIIGLWGRDATGQLDATDDDLPAQQLTYALRGHDCATAPALAASGALTYTCPDAITQCQAQVEVSDGQVTASRDVTLRCEDTAPTITDVAISPGTIARMGVTLTCDYTFDDAEGDADVSRVEWLIEGAVVATGRTFSTYQPGDLITCRVTGSDGLLDAAPQTSPALTAPIQPQLAAGAEHTCAIRAGSLSCWGARGLGVLGVPLTATSSYAPVTPAGMDADVTAVAANRHNTCAIKAGALYCWGYNSDGQLGKGSAGGGTPGTGAHEQPAPVLDMQQDVTAVAVGGSSACAIKAGALYCWGDNFDGRLGDGTTQDQPRPRPVLGMSAEVTAVSMGAGHTCAIRAGALYCWGYNNDGQLGVPGAPTSHNTSPLPVPGMADHVELVAAGVTHTCALRLGQLSCWGSNRAGQLGDATTTERDAPTLLTTPAGVKDMALGESTTCAIHSAGLSCWGDNTQGQLGDGTTTQRRTPVAVTGLDPAPLHAIALGKLHTCAAQGDQTACWGDNTYGTLGIPNAAFTSPTPLRVAGISGATKLAHGPSAIVSGALIGWRFMPAAPLLGLDADVEDAASGCAVRAGGLVCWGDNQRGQVGDGTTTARPNPVPVPTMSAGVSATSTSVYHSCAIRSGALYCWGENTYGQLGDGTTTRRTSPTPVLNMGAGVTRVAAGGRMTCAVKDGALYCWGNNQQSQLGLTQAGPNQTSTPTLVPGMEASVSDVAVVWNDLGATQGHACAIRAGALYCWGRDSSGQLGQPSVVTLHTPTLIAGMEVDVERVVTSPHHTCMIQAGGVFCMGDNASGQIGQPLSTPLVRSPQPVVPLQDQASDLFAEFSGSCALRAGQVYCWGRASAHDVARLGSLTPRYITP